MSGVVSKEDRKVLAATSEDLRDSEWSLNLDIADEINRSADGGVAFLRAIKRRLAHKSTHVHWLTLVLLESTVKNANHEYHDQLSAADTLKLISDIATKSTAKNVRDKALAMIQDWSDTFTPTGLLAFSDAYNKLRQRGIVFPERNGAPIRTPALNVTAVNATSRRKSSAASDEERRADYQRLTQANSLEYIQKIKRETARALEYILLLREVVMGANSTDELKANESVHSLVSTVNDIRSRMTLLLVELDNEELISLMIQLNEIVRAVIDYHQIKLKGAFHTVPDIQVPLSIRPYMAQTKPQPQPQPTPTPTPQPLLSFEQLTIRQPQTQQTSAAATTTSSGAFSAVASRPPPNAVSAANPLADFDPLA